jgi:hypothetical protein
MKSFWKIESFSGRLQLFARRRLYFHCSLFVAVVPHEGAHLDLCTVSNGSI